MKTRMRWPVLASVLVIALAPMLEALTNPAQREFHQVIPAYSLRSIVIDNAIGNIKIVGWQRVEIQIDAIKRGKDQGAVDSASVDVQTHGDKVCIYTRYAQDQKSWLSWFGVQGGPCGSGQNIHADPNDLASVDYTISVPSALYTHIGLGTGRLEISELGGEIDAEDINGDIFARALRGPAKITSINGSVEAAFLSLNGQTRIHALNGNITVRLAPEVRAELEAQTNNGAINNEFGLTPSALGEGQRLQGSVGSGGPRFEVVSEHGRIEIKKLVVQPATTATPVKRESVDKPKARK